MAYREPAPLSPRPRSPDVDPALFRMRWWQPALVVSLLVLPLYLIGEWTGNMTLKVNGHAYPPTLTQHVVATALVAVWFAVLLIAWARHRQTERAAYLALQSPNESAHVRVAETNEPRTRVALEHEEAESHSEIEVDVAKQRRVDGHR